MTEQTQAVRTPEKRWYVIHTYSGYENKVKANLEHRIESMGMEDKIFQVLVPMEDEIEIRQGQRHTVQRKVYPGYVLVEMILDPDSWYVVRNTPGVTSFVGGANIPGTRNEPVPLDETEVKQILRQMGVETPRYRVAFTRQGTPVPVNDVWIAATAAQHGLRLLTLDSHFLQIPQVIVDFFEPARPER